TFTREQIMEYAAYAECYSTHPIATSILQVYGKEVRKDRIKVYEEVPGYGIKVQVDEEQILVGNEKLFVQENIPVPTIETIGTLVHVAIDREYAGYLIISD